MSFLAGFKMVFNLLSFDFLITLPFHTMQEYGMRARNVQDPKHFEEVGRCKKMQAT